MHLRRVPISNDSGLFGHSLHCADHSPVFIAKQHRQQILFIDWLWVMSMKKHAWKSYVFWIILAELVGGLSGWLTRESTEIYRAAITKPPLSPPGVVFPIVWVILFALMGVGGARICLAPASAVRSRSLLIFLAQLAVNFFWSIIFFNLQAFGFAFLWLLLLWVLILRMILSFRMVDKTAARLQIPYLLWVTFAAYLNFGVWLLNR